MTVAINGNGYLTGAVLKDVPMFSVSIDPPTLGGATLALTPGNTAGVNFWGTKLTDNFTWFNLATGRYTPLIEGWYELHLTSLQGGAATLSTLYAAFRKNGTEFARASQHTAGATIDSVSATAMVYLNGSTDYVDAVLFNNSASPTVYRDGAYTRFLGKLVRYGP